MPGQTSNLSHAKSKGIFFLKEPQGKKKSSRRNRKYKLPLLLLYNIDIIMLHMDFRFPPSKMLMPVQGLHYNKLEEISCF